MPSEHKVLVVLRGTEEYADWLRRQAERLKLDGPNAVAEYALKRLGTLSRYPAPERVPPQGTNRHGRPKKKPV